jgi:CRP-like cAMP-binding protein
MRKVLFIFGELTDGDVEWLAKAGERVHLDPGMLLIPLGSRVDHLYIVLDGQLVVKTAASTPIARLESGEIVGEMSLVDPAPTAVSVEVSTPATLFRIPHEKLRKHLSTDFAFAARFYRAICVFLADRMRAATQRLGYGDVLSDQKGELNENVLDSVHLAGARFDRMLKKLAAG